MKRLLLAFTAILAIGAGWALAQNVVIQGGMTGNEAWQIGAGGPAGPGFYTNLAAVKNGTIYATIPTGTTVTQTISPNVGEVIVTGAITTLNLSLPTAPYDQQTVKISCPGGTASTVNISAPVVNGVNYGLAPVGPSFSACNSGVITSMSAIFMFSSATTSWLRLQ